VHPQNESFKSIGNNVGKKIPHSNRSTTDLQRPWLISVEDKPDLNLINQCEVDFVLKTSFMAESRGKTQICLMAVMYVGAMLAETKLTAKRDSWQ
jgi:hypothetical protein